MKSFIQAFLDQVADRVTALIARLVTSHIEVRCIEHQAEVQGRIDELASHYDDSGQTEVAEQLRRLRQHLTSDAIVPSGEALLNQMRQQTAMEATSADAAANSSRRGIRQRRTSSKRLVALENAETTTADADAGSGFQVQQS